MHFSFTTRFQKLTATTSILAVALLALNVHGQAVTTQPSTPAQDKLAPPLFTEDFESGSLNKDIWDVRIGGGGGGGRGARAAGAATQPANAAAPATMPSPAPSPATPPTITVQNDLAAHGKHALLVHYPPNSRAYAFIVAPHLPDSLKDHFFGRAYVQFPKAPPNAHDSFITCGSPGFPTSNFLEIGLRQNKAQLSYQQNGAGALRGETMIAGPAYPVGKWFCLEWEFNDDPDTIVIWIDGAKVTDNKVVFHGTGDHLVKGFTDFAFGFRSFGNVPNGFDVYYDDIAFGTARIGPVN